MPSELERSRISNLALRRDVKAVQERCETMQGKAADREATAAKLNEQIFDLCSRFEERGEQLKEATSVKIAKEEEVKEYQAAFHLAKDKLMEQRYRIAEWKVKHAGTKSKLTISEHVRTNFIATLKKMEEEPGDFGQQLTKQGENQSIRNCGVATVMLANQLWCNEFSRFFRRKRIRAIRVREQVTRALFRVREICLPRHMETFKNRQPVP